MRRAALVLVFVVAVVVPSTARAQNTPVSDPVGPVPLPAGQSIYRPPLRLAAGDPGTLVWYQALQAPSAGTSAWRVLFRSRSAEGWPILVTGLAIRPATPPPAEGYPVLVVASGTPGLADQCAPSKTLTSVPGLIEALEAGFLVVVNDGEGLGTPGLTHYLVGSSEAQTTLDAVRAAQQFPETSVSSDVALFGYSAGGHSVLFAAESAARYAPELDVVGVAVAAPVSDVAWLVGRPRRFFGLTFYTLGGWARFRRIDPSTLFTDAVVTQLPRLDQECAWTLLQYPMVARPSDVLTTDPLTAEPWRTLLDRQRAGRRDPGAPVLVIQGAEDTVIPGPMTDTLVHRLCRFGQPVDLRVLAGVDHTLPMDRLPDLISWLGDRVRRVPAATSCT